MIAAMIALMVLWIVALIDVARREFPGDNDKLMWVLVVVLAGWIGALIYWFVGRQKGTLRA
ncbi:MAG: PLDc_N domain-containing protein [Armatimonadetes bacterium]|nr:PLDc_N domain-containing protein [Armatimonadota bacterium]